MNEWIDGRITFFFFFFQNEQLKMNFYASSNYVNRKSATEREISQFFFFFFFLVILTYSKDVHLVKLNRRKTGLGQILCVGLLVKLQHIVFFYNCFQIRVLTLVRFLKKFKDFISYLPTFNSISLKLLFGTVYHPHFSDDTVNKEVKLPYPGPQNQSLD